MQKRKTSFLNYAGGQNSDMSYAAFHYKYRGRLIYFASYTLPNKDLGSFSWSLCFSRRPV